MAAAPVRRSELGEALRACRSAFIGVGVMSCMINLLYLTGSIFMLEVYDRVIPSRSVPTLIGLVVLAGGLYVAQGGLDLIRGRILGRIGTALDEVLKRMSAPDSPVQHFARINEVSSSFENMIRDLLNAAPGLSCDFPKTADEKVQRSGYPDLRLVDTATKRVYYMDPKLYAAGARASSFRTFYFEPKVATNKVRDDAVHLILGFEHEPRKAGHWNFTRWDLVDLSQFKVKLKAEFQGSNRDMYRPEAIVGSSAAP
jgi:hypothetical protein